MKYMSHFMRTNILTKENIQNQLFFFSKEALQNAVMNSKCGIIKSISKNDINIFNGFSPLLCIYKRANYKYNLSSLKEEKFKKDINITGNAFMTLGLLELVRYLRSFKNIEDEKYLHSSYYLSLAEKQLDFYSSNLRNDEGIFVDKKEISEEISDKLKFQIKDNVFNFADQALIMSAYYSYSTFSESKVAISYRDFSMDILEMFLEYKDELYEATFSQLAKLCLGIAIFYSYSKNPQALYLLLDLADFIVENYKSQYLNFQNKNLSSICTCSIVYSYIYKVTGFIKYKELQNEIASQLFTLYDENAGIFIKESDKKEFTYYCDEIILYLYSLILFSGDEANTKSMDMAIVDIFKHLIINSGLVESWPESPKKDVAERYVNRSYKEEDFLQDNNFRIDTLPTPEQAEFPPVFNKGIIYNRKKTSFLPVKPIFDTTKNMFIYFITLFLFNDYH